MTNKENDTKDSSKSNQVSIDEVLAYNPFDFVEPCEPECTPERHAYHQGQWDMACRVCEHFGVLPNPVDGDKIPRKAKASILEALPKVEHSIFCKVFDGAHISHCTCEGKIYNQALDDIIQALKLEEK